jgi:hypothetical protein
MLNFAFYIVLLNVATEENQLSAPIAFKN